nr:MAG TPA: hypothetical protein [Caudoviricetes sp.]
MKGGTKQKLINNSQKKIAQAIDKAWYNKNAEEILPTQTYLVCPFVKRRTRAVKSGLKKAENPCRQVGTEKAGQRQHCPAFLHRRERNT